MKPPYVWTYDPIAKAGYLKLSNGAVERTIELIEGLNLDIEEDGSVHGIEVLQAKHQPSKSDEIEEIEEDEMTPFEQNLAQAILSALEYRGFYDCGKYLDTSLIEHLRPILDAETKKAVEEILANADIEKLSEVVHKAYCQYQKEIHGIDYWTGGDYSKLDDKWKEADRYTVRAILQALTPPEDLSGKTD